MLYIGSLIATYFFGSGNLHIKVALLCLSLFAEFIWYWEVNALVQTLIKESTKNNILCKSFILFMLIDNLVWIICRYESKVLDALVGESVVIFLKDLGMFFLGMKWVYSAVLAILFTINLRKVFTERSALFLMVELFLVLLAMINLTPMLKEELESQVRSKATN